MSRTQPNVVVQGNVRNQSSRGGVRPSLIVIHTTESHEQHGSGDLRAIGNWFNNPAAQSSAHVCTDGDGNSARYVPDSAKAWSCVNFNSRSLNVEQIGHAADSQPSWLRRRAELKETARWIARWSKAYGIPIRKGAVSGLGVIRSGIVRHSDLGAAGGGHHDPGGNYPLALVLRYAKYWRRRI